MRFTEEMSKFLVEIVKENEEDLFPSSQKKDSRKTQEDAWKFVHSEITNQFPTSGITLQHCKEKWTKVKQAAKAMIGKCSFCLTNFIGVLREMDKLIGLISE